MFKRMSKIDIPSKKIRSDANLLRGWVIYQLTLQGRSLAAVGREAAPPVTRQVIYAAFRHPYPRMEKLIADALGLAPTDLWPERYDEHGLPNRPMGRPAGGAKKSSTKDTRKSGGRNVNDKPACRHGEAA